MTDIQLLRKGCFRQKAADIAALVYPSRCPVCDRPVWPSAERICFSCMKELRALRAPFCEKCGKKVPQGICKCSDCGKTDHSFTRCRSAFEYGAVRDALYRFKYLGRREYAGIFAEMTVRVLEDYIMGIRPDAVAFVPLSREKELKRGYNQAYDYALELSKALGLPLLTDSLRRVKNTAPMKLLSPSERRKNLKNAFKSGQNVVKSLRILLVDDIYTTGATMDACSGILLDAGAEAVYGITLASGEGV